MRERRLCGHPAARGPHQESLLEQIGLVDVLDRVGLLPHRHGQGREAHGPAAEFLADRREDVAVQAIEAGLVHLEQLEPVARHLLVDASCTAHLGEVADPLEKAVGHARGAARARGDDLGARVVHVHLEDAGGAAHDPGQVGRLVKVETVGDTEAVAQRRGEQPRARGGSDQREGGKVQRHHRGARALAHGDRQPAVLHGRVEGLLESARQAVDLVHEEHAARRERGEIARDVALALERRPRGGHELGLELVGHDLRQRGLAEARWAPPAARGRAPRPGHGPPR